MHYPCETASGPRNMAPHEGMFYSRGIQGQVRGRDIVDVSSCVKMSFGLNVSEFQHRSQTKF